VVGAVLTDRADPPLSKRIRVRRRNRRPGDFRVLGAEELVEGAGELAVAVADQELHVLEMLVGCEVPGLLCRPPRVRVRHDSGEMNTPQTQLDEEQHLQPAQPDRIDGKEAAGQCCAPGRAGTRAPRRPVASWRGPEACVPEDRADRRRADVNTELVSLALDAHAAPARVLSRQTQHKITHRRVDAGSAGPALPVGLPPAHQRAMPAKQCLLRDNEQLPSLPLEQPARGSKHNAITSQQSRPPRLSAGHRAAHLRVLRTITAP